jgi:NTP pyrophosphatase (non-canonical NTP hydrolase)
MNRELIREIIEFRDERNWKQFHNAKDLAISLSLEAAELLENFQWMTHEEATEKKQDKILEELADVLIYAVLFADAMNADIEIIIKEKLLQNRKKYPVEKAFGKKEKYTEYTG